MLTEIIYNNGLYMTGTVSQVRLRLAEHTSRYEKLLDLLNAKKTGDSSDTKKPF